MKYRAKMRLIRLHKKRLRKRFKANKLFDITLSKFTKGIAEIELRARFTADSLQALSTSLDRMSLDLHGIELKSPPAWQAKECP